MQLQKIERNIATMLRTEQRLYKQKRKMIVKKEEQNKRCKINGLDQKNENNNVKKKFSTAKEIDVFLNGSWLILYIQQTLIIIKRKTYFVLYEVITRYSVIS